MSKDPLTKVKPEILKIKAYDLKPCEAQIKLNQNENPYDPPLFLKGLVARQLMDHPWSRYPDFKATRLCKKLANHSGWIPQGVTVGNGSNELLQNLLHLFLDRGKKLLIVPPTFALYRILGLSNGATLIEVPFDDFSSFPRNALLEAIEQERPDAMIFCTPNNPTGTVMDRETLRDVLDLTDGVVILDQAYHEFCEFHATEFLSQYPNLIITRTFSKALAAAGLRMGYVLAHPEVVTQLEKIKLPYNINFVTLTAAEAILDHMHCSLEPIQELIRERRRLFENMREIKGVEVFPSEANFLLFRVRDAARVFSQLRSQGILIRDVSGAKGLENCLRVSVGLPHENLEFLRALKETVI
ncbi:MAG TPA: histidinol-phosphate transaminase [Acidobacteriota bacterium]|jgi:histidinol-phosphate aminotransferase